MATNKGIFATDGIGNADRTGEGYTGPGSATGSKTSAKAETTNENYTTRYDSAGGIPDRYITIQSGGRVFSPPVEEGIKIEWERSGSPGKMTFTTPKVEGNEFYEGDAVTFYYGNNPVFKGYVFTKKRDREQRIKVTCYDQIRYLKNKYTYVFENKTANQITAALCNDFGLNIGSMDSTGYVIPVIAEENKAAIDIILGALEDTLLNTGNMYVLYDNAGAITLRNCANMVSDTLIMETTAENFDYTSSIDNETYNNVILYYKEENNTITLYTASSPSRMNQWGTLQYFEEVKNKTIAQNKANSILQLYGKKSRELKITGAFGSTDVRGGTLIPVQLNLGDVIVNNYLLVDKVTHNFEKDLYTMDLTLQGDWNDGVTDMVSNNNEKKSDISNELIANPESIYAKDGIGNADRTGETLNTPGSVATNGANSALIGALVGIPNK